MNDLANKPSGALSCAQQLNRFRLLIIAPIAGIFVLWQCARADSAPTFGAWESVMKCVGLLPQAKRQEAQSMLTYLEEQLGKKLSADERQVFLREASGTWKRFSDDLVSFDLPDEPLLKVVSFEPEENPALAIVGGAVGTTDRSFTKVYRITVGQGIPYGLVLVSNETWFDEGICLCGAIALKTFVPADGNLIELSQLANGEIKKFQVISESHRAVLFEWTHSAITQSAYARIGASLRLQSSSHRTINDWIALTKEKRSTDPGVGWLRPGMNKTELLSVMGLPAQKKGHTLIYRNDRRFDDGRGYRTTTNLVLEKDRLQRLNASYEELAAPKGTNAWIDDSLRAWSQAADKLAEGKAPKVPKQDVALILKRFHEEAKSATGEDWEFWCQTISSLKQLSIKDSSAADLIAARCMDQSLPQYGTCWVLERYGRSELRSFVRARLRFILDASEEAKAFAGESGNLFATLEDSDPDKVSFVREGVVHPNAKIREAAIRSLQILSKDEGKEFLRRALVDSSEGVRFSAILEIKNFCTRADFEWLNAALEKETDAANRRYLSEKMQDLKQD